MRLPLYFLLLATLSAPAWAQSVPTAAPAPPSSELDALTLADDAKMPQEAAAGAWRVYLESAVNRRSLPDLGTRARALRGSLDVRFDGSLAPGLRLVVSNRLDLVDDGLDPPARNVNTLREAFVSWSPAQNQTLDLGRVNVRHGVAWGYNPTDWFKDGALRGIVSPDPAALRENRQGTVVLRGQQLWSSGAVSLTLSPKLASLRAGETRALSLDLPATNGRDRWQIAGSWRLAEGISPEVLLFGGEGLSTQFGFNLSALATDAIVVFGEATVGRGPGLAALAGQVPAASEQQQRAAVGLTYTSPFNLSVTLEAEHNSAAADRAQWQTALASGPTAALQLLGTASAMQDLPVRNAVFAYMTWKDALVRNVDISAFVRQEAMTHSRSQWIEVRHRWPRADLSIQLLQNTGATGSVYRLIPVRRTIEAAVRWYL